MRYLGCLDESSSASTEAPWMWSLNVFLRHPHPLDLEGDLISWKLKTGDCLEQTLHASERQLGKGHEGRLGRGLVLYHENVQYRDDLIK